jgi:hypothetical protein
VYSPEHYVDLMTYCEDEWISDTTYEGLMDFFQNPPALGANAGLAAGIPEPEQRVLLVGFVDPQTNDVSLQPLFTFSDFGDLIARIPGEFSIVLRNIAGAELARYAFTPTAGQDIDVLYIRELVPFLVGTTRVDIEGPTGILHTVSAGASAPEVRLLTPNGGEVLDGDPITVT